MVARDRQPAPDLNSRSTQDLREVRASAGAHLAGAGAPSPQPASPAAPSETLKRHNANSFALWPPRRCHGAAAENKHNSPHVFSAPSTPRPSAPAPAFAARALPGCVARSCAAPVSGRPKGSRAPPGQPWGRAATVARIPQRPRCWQGGVERRRRSGWGRHEKTARTAPGMLTPAPRPPLRGEARGRGKGTVSGRAGEKQEPGYGTTWLVAPSPSHVETTTRG